MAAADALALLAGSDVMHYASVTPDGAPQIRVVHGVALDGMLAFHGGASGEKLAGLGRNAVFSVHKVVASIPSYFFDPERACPATTYYLSAQVEGVLSSVADRELKTRVIRALMLKYQPEGGYAPLESNSKMYEKAIESLLVASLPTTKLSGKAKVGQNLEANKRRRLLEKLWERGETDDPKAIETIIDHSPGTPAPSFLAAPDGVRLRCHMPGVFVAPAAALLQDQYWNTEVNAEQIARAHLATPAWVGATTQADGLIASARAIGDVAKHGYIVDVVVKDAWRARGIGTRVMELLLEHPALRKAPRVWLKTRDARRFYERLGFRQTGPSSALTEMAFTPGISSGPWRPAH